MSENPTPNPAAAPDSVQSHRAERTGEVVSTKMMKTIVVRVERRFRHARFKKVVTSYNKFYAHDERGEAKMGDIVRIIETRPLSKTKCWRLVEIVTPNAAPAPVTA